MSGPRIRVVLRALVIAALVWTWLGAPSEARSGRASRRASAELTRGLIGHSLEDVDGRVSTVVVLVRHAEKRPDGDDPGLTRRGRRRAVRLARVLRGADRLFASEYRRTRSTLEPLARAAGRFVEIRPGRAIDELARELRALETGTLAVVAGHSNTVPAIIRALGADPGVRDLPEDSFDHLFIVVLSTPGSGAAPVLHDLRFDP